MNRQRYSFIKEMDDEFSVLPTSEDEVYTFDILRKYKKDDDKMEILSFPGKGCESHSQIEFFGETILQNPGFL